MNSKNFLSLAIVLVLVSSHVLRSQTLNDGLVAFYPFNGNVNDESGNGNDGTASDVTFVNDRFGLPNSAGSFAGNSSSHVIINSTDLNLLPDFTVSVWINYTAGAGTEGPRIIGTSGYEITTDSTFVTERHINFDNTFSPGSGFTYVSSSDGVPAGVWTHIVGVRVIDELKLYINGSPAGSVSATELPDYSRGFVPKIGQNPGNDQDNYAGLIDDLRIYKRALSSDEVAYLYAIESSPRPTDTTPPIIVCPTVVSVPCSTDLLAPVAFNVSATDDMDPNPIVVCDPPSGSGFTIGSTMVTCTATDAAGNQSHCSFNVNRAALEFMGFSTPIGGSDSTGGTFANPIRTFKLTSTIPVKFTASCGGTPVLVGVHTLAVTKFSNATTGDAPIDATPQDAATTGNQFRLTDGAWHYNLDPKKTGMSTGIWLLTASLSDGSKHSVWIQLK